MLKISDFSKLTHVSVRMLRYYDTQGLLKPAFIDPENGYRLYEAKQVPILQKIILLRDLNFSVSEISFLLNHWEEESLTLEFKKKIKEIHASIAASKLQVKQLNSALEHIKTNELEQYYNVTIKTIPEYPVISLRRRVSSYFDEGLLWKELSEYVKQNHIEIDHSARNNIALYHDNEYLDTGIDIEVCLIVHRLKESKDGFTYRILDGVSNMACMMVYGPYENIAGAYSSFTAWLDKNEPYEMGSISRQITIIDSEDTNNPEEYLTEIQIPLICLK